MADPTPAPPPAPTRGSVIGRVVDAVGGAVGGAAVAVVESAGPHPDIAARTTDDGSFRLGGLPAGQVVLEARKAGASGSAALEVRAGESAAVEICLGAPLT
jgi:Carboxypeptidase regulatory-like domain